MRFRVEIVFEDGARTLCEQFPDFERAARYMIGLADQRACATARVPASARAIDLFDGQRLDFSMQVVRD